MYPLQVKHLSKVFKSPVAFWQRQAGFTAVDNLSFELQQGEILGFLGPNGAGKTTTIHMLLGTLLPTSGSICYFGKDLTTNRSEALQEIGFATTYERLPGRLTVYENLDFYARLYHLSANKRRDAIEHFLKVFGIGHLKDRMASRLSAGEMTRALLAKAFIPYPKVLLFDEPTASLDPEIAHEVRHFILEQRKQCGTSVVFTSHNMDEVTEVCDRVIVLQKGKLIAQDTPENLASGVSQICVRLISSEVQRIETYARQEGLPYKSEDRTILLHMDEHKIAPFLAGLTEQGISYTHISIEKPSLEDYFLSIAKSR